MESPVPSDEKRMRSRQLSLIELPFPLSSRAKPRRALRSADIFLAMFFDRERSVWKIAVLTQVCCKQAQIFRFEDCPARHSRVGSSSGSGVSCAGLCSSGTWRRLTRMRVHVDDVPRMESTSTSSTARSAATSGYLLFHLSRPASASSLLENSRPRSKASSSAAEPSWRPTWPATEPPAAPHLPSCESAAAMAHRPIRRTHL